MNKESNQSIHKIQIKSKNLIHLRLTLAHLDFKGNSPRIWFNPMTGFISHSGDAEAHLDDDLALKIKRTIREAVALQWERDAASLKKMSNALDTVPPDPEAL